MRRICELIEPRIIMVHFTNLIGPDMEWPFLDHHEQRQVCEEIVLASLIFEQFQSGVHIRDSQPYPICKIYNTTEIALLLTALLNKTSVSFSATNNVPGL